MGMTSRIIAIAGRVRGLGAAFAVALLLLASNQAGAANDGLRDTAPYSARGEKWVDKTRKTLHKLPKEIGVSEMIKIGAPAYYHIRNLVERGESFNVSPGLVAGELSKVVEYGGADLRFVNEGERYAKNTLRKAASYLPTKVIQRIPELDARTVIGRGWFRQYASGRAVININDVKISLHELGHALEHSSVHLLRLRKEIYENVTRGEGLRRLNTFHLPFGYGRGEKYRAGFVSRYMGKEGGVEVYSCGIEYVFFNRFDIWHRDPDVTKFILGSLIFYGKS